MKKNCNYQPYILKPLFQLQCAGDIEIQKVQQISIIFCGQTKVGKTNVFQYVKGTPMIGKKKHGTIIYEIISEGQKIGHKFASQTVIPAVAPINFGEGCKITMIDMAGFKDNRDYVGVFAISYMLLKVFEKLKKAKFVITIDQGPLLDGKIQDIQATFASFIKMMQYKNLTRELKNQVLRSSYLCLTKTKVNNQQQKQQYYQRIEGLAEKIKEEKNQIEHSEQMIQFLENFVKFKKIFFFNRAQQNVQPAEPQQFKNKLMRQDSQGFGFIDIDKLRAFGQGNAIKLPFKQSFKQLVVDGDTEKMNADAEWKQKSFSDISKIISLFIYNLSCDDHIHNNSVSYKHLFHLLKLFLRKYGIYRVMLKSEDQPERWMVSISQQIKAVGFNFQLKEGQIKKRPTGLQLMGLLQILYKNSVEVSPQQFKQSQILTALHAFKQIFASSYEEEQILIDLAYCVGVRSVKELASLQQMNHQIVAFRLNLINDIQNCSSFPFSSFKRDYIFSIFGKHRSSLTKILENESQFESLVKLVEGFQPENDDDRIQFEKIKVQLHQLKGDYSMQRQKYGQAIQHYCDGNRYLQEYKVILQKAYKENENQSEFQQDPSVFEFQENPEFGKEDKKQQKSYNIQIQLNEISKKLKAIQDIDFTQNQSINFNFLESFDLKKFQTQKLVVLPRKYDTQMRQIIIFRKIGLALRKINNIKSLQLAKQVFHHIQDVENSVIVLKTISQHQQQLFQKIQTMYQHAKYAQSHGRKEQSIKIYQKILSINEDPRIYFEICKRIHENQMDPKSHEYNQRLGKSQIQNHKQLIIQIQKYISSQENDFLRQSKISSRSK